MDAMYFDNTVSKGWNIQNIKNSLEKMVTCV